MEDSREIAKTIPCTCLCKHALFSLANNTEIFGRPAVIGPALTFSMMYTKSDWKTNALIVKELMSRLCTLLYFQLWLLLTLILHYRQLKVLLRILG